MKPPRLVDIPLIVKIGFAPAAKEIKAQISDSSDQVGSGVALVGQTGEALSRIVVKVGEIAASAHEQAAGLQQVSLAVNQMDEVTQRNAAMVQQSTAATHSLKGDTAKLVGLIGRFTLNDGAAQSAPVDTVPRQPAPAANPVAEARERLIALVRPAGQDGALARTGSDWAKF